MWSAMGIQQVAALYVPVFLHTHMHAVAAFSQITGSESTGPEPPQLLVKFAPKCCELSVLIIFRQVLG